MLGNFTCSEDTIAINFDDEGASDRIVGGLRGRKQLGRTLASESRCKKLGEQWMRVHLTEGKKAMDGDIILGAKAMVAA